MRHSTRHTLNQTKSYRKKRYEFWETCKRMFRTPSAKVGGIIFVIMVGAGLLAPLIAPFDPMEMDLRSIFQAPSAAHWFGTDAMGRDIFSRVLHGTKYSVALGVICSFTGTICGIILGSVAGYFGGIVEDIIMRFCDIWMAIPGMLLTIILSAALGAGFFNTVLAMSIGHIPNGARMTRGMILAEREKEYIEAAESINTPKTSIMFKHLLPNVISPSLLALTMGVGANITGAAGLSYLGLGIQPPMPEWGAMLSDGTKYIMQYPYMILFPGLVIGIFVFAVNLMGDGLRDALDPKLRH